MVARWCAIGGATGSTYTLGDADVGAMISVQVSYTDLQGTNESVTSAQTAAVANINDAPTGSVNISGTPTEDQILTASTHWPTPMAWVPFSYQWYRDGVAIGGATGTTYTLGDADVGATITVTGSYTDGRAPVRVSPVPAWARSPTSMMHQSVCRPSPVRSPKISC